MKIVGELGAKAEKLRPKTKMAARGRPAFAAAPTRPFFQDN
jgi:hypothetical protein